jgi:hypothetical protein
MQTFVWVCGQGIIAAIMERLVTDVGNKEFFTRGLH